MIKTIVAIAFCLFVYHLIDKTDWDKFND